MSPTSPTADLSKAAVVDAFRDSLNAEVVTVERVAAMARDETTNSETRQEGKYDTRAIEASYSARGQATRISALRRLRAWFAVFDGTTPLDPPVVQTGALVVVQEVNDAEDGPVRTFFVAPDGGRAVTVGSETIELMSPRSPFFQAMAELEQGDEFSVHSPKGTREYALSRVS